ncbi:MAG TPA: ATP-dependent helicase C-terminal domain-containing protein [Vicinamibacterales bacterium]|nr:ATP-dependent helicase C-terminal domain-containing protein [Vicinamibacterales bacterium]
MTARLPLQPLPIDVSLPAIVDALATRRAVVVTAAPGAGKTTRVPPALVVDGPVLLLQPRRVAARSIARRIAEERGWSIGREVGWQVRFERNFTSETRLLVATEGVLTARLQQDPLAAGFRTIVIDEFHERSVHVDVGLALAREAWRARPDLRLVIMSATIDAARVAAYLDGCPVIDVPGRLFPLDVSYQPGIAVEDAVAQMIPGLTGAVLCFLPGAPEIRRTAERLAGRSALRGVPVLPLHGSLDADDQDAVLRPSSASRVILATNLAETTVTVPDVTAVIDTGLHKVARYDADRAIDSLETERVTQDSADQRAGRAGRLQAGRAVRLWDARDRLRPHREPEIARVDLASTVLDIIAWGGDPRTLGWFEAPPPSALAGAIDLLERLGALDRDARLTELGSTLRRIPVHPRLARMLVASGGSLTMARACAWLSERHSGIAQSSRQATSCDLLAAVERGRLPAHVERAAAQIQRAAGSSTPGALSDDAFRRAVLAGYPDRVARRRPGSTDRFVLASGAGARLGRESGVINHEFIVAVDVTAGEAIGADALIRIATGVDRGWVTATSKGVRHEFDGATGGVRANRVEMYESLVLSEHPMPPDPIEAGRILADEYLRRGPSEPDSALIRRLAFAGVTMEFRELVAGAAAGKTRLADIDLEAALPFDVRRVLETHAPAALAVPSGRTVALEYRDGGIVAASVKLQELFGLADSPRVGRARVPVTFELLSPAGRPVQVTNDLRSFWTRGYPEVRKELRARYPKHPWPEDPWTATPTHRTIRRSPR